MYLRGIIGAVMADRRESVLISEWHELLERHARVHSALDRALNDEHQLGVSEFEVLDRLAAFQEDGCRIQELSGTVHLSQSALSRVVARLETEGLVKRAMCEQDRRGIFAGLTDAGRERHAAALPTHRE